MEYENGQPNPGMLGCDRDLFARVWARVSPAPGEGCPIEVLPPQSGLPQPQPAPDLLGEDSLPPNDVPCLGREGGDHARFLQAAIREELGRWRQYQALSARGGAAGHTLAAIGADKRRQARRLSGACFLISGVRFLPDLPPLPTRPGNFWGKIRELFWLEQQTSHRYTAAAAETSDLCLAQLYLDLANQTAAHADLLRSLTEQM